MILYLVRDEIRIGVMEATALRTHSSALEPVNSCFIQVLRKYFEPLQTLGSHLILFPPLSLGKFLCYSGSMLAMQLRALD
jgi:hypothetical protein